MAAPGTTEPEPASTGPELLTVEVNRVRIPGGSLRVALVAGSVALVLAVCTAVLLVVRLAGGGGLGAAAPVVAPAGPVTSAASVPEGDSPSEPPYRCRIERIDGRWYAGNSRTRNAVLAHGHAGQEVAEVQCLLRRAGISPGGIDGIFGPLTERAVRQLQERAGLVVDGIVGPHTWKALRR
ncbi:peptidoglycan-binding protein [Streptomyces sp. NPDC049627]|uniref:peptidoglycan-binding protein n=1 Tax=Streptomyces sp. NPDC049627 TaxID=3365595 RepID=UPI00378E1AEB